MTTITSYAGLRQNIVDYTKRSGDDMLNKLDLFIDLAERDIWELLRVREMEARATAVTNTSDRFVELPPGFIKMRQLQITVDDRLYDLPFTPLPELRIGTDAGIPSRFTVTSQIELNRISDQAYTLEMDYWRELEPLSDTNSTNDILTYYPGVYLSCCLRHAFLWAQQEDLANYWAAQSNTAITRANRKSRQGRYGPVPTISMSGGMIV
jgi:hypothetical protein